MANEVATPRQPSELQIFRGQLEQRARDIQMALPRGIDAGQFQRTLITAAQQNPALLKADRRSLILASIKSAQDGLVPDGREAALVTFKTRVKEDGDWVSKELVQYMPMVYGLRKKILQARDADGAPIVSALQVGVVFKAEVEQGYFRWERGTDPEIQHRPMLDVTAEEAADENIVAAYSIAIMSDGTRSCEVMRRFEIDQVRQMSQTGALGQKVKFGADKGKEIPPKGPWVDWFAEMAKKTVMRRHSKTLPMSGDVLMGLRLGDEAENDLAALSAAHILDSEEGSEPQRIEDHSDELPPHDGETGEIIEGEAQQEEAEKKPRGRKPKPKEEEAQPEAEAGDQAGDEDPGRDEMGITKDPAEAKAEEVLDLMAKTTTIIDLERIYNEAEGHREAMPNEIRDVVEGGYQRHRRRLAPALESAK